MGAVQSRERILRDWYSEHYNKVSASADGSRFQTYPHRAMERPFDETRAFRRVLEVGGNRGEHIPFVRHQFDEYVLTDLYPPELAPALAGDPRITLRECDAARLPFSDAEFDRVISTCLLHHVDDPLAVLQELRRVTVPTGIITLMLPTDPSLAYRAGVWMSSRRRARKQGVELEMRLVKALDHRNHFRSIAAQAEHVFRADHIRVSFFPFGIRSVEFNAFTVWQIELLA